MTLQTTTQKKKLKGAFLALKDVDKRLKKLTNSLMLYKMRNCSLVTRKMKIQLRKLMKRTTKIIYWLLKLVKLRMMMRTKKNKQRLKNLFQLSNLKKQQRKST